MTPVSIVGGQCLTASGLEALSLTFEGETITAISPVEPDAPAARQDPGDPAVIDASGLVVSPGFIELQVNGGYGHDLQDDPGLVWDLGRKLPRSGVTSFLPTIISGPRSRTRSILEALRERPAGYCGAEPLGAHFEGPMLSTNHPGAHRHEHLTGACADVIDGWHRSTGVTMVTIAPELAGALDVHRRTRAGEAIIVAAGHTAAHEGRDPGGHRGRREHGHPPIQRHGPSRASKSQSGRRGHGGQAPHRHHDRRRRARRSRRGGRGLERQGSRPDRGW